MAIRIKHIVNIASALIVFIGGMIILVYFSGHLSMGVRVAIGVFVSVYFAFRISKTYKSIKWEAQRLCDSKAGGGDREGIEKRQSKSS